MAGILPGAGQSSPQTRFGGDQGLAEAFQKLLAAQSQGASAQPGNGGGGGAGPGGQASPMGAVSPAMQPFLQALLAMRRASGQGE